MFISETYVPKFEWRRDLTAKAETWTTLTWMSIQGSVTRQNPEFGEEWLASIIVEGEMHPLYPKATRLEAQAAAEGAMVALDWIAPEMVKCDDLPAAPFGTVAAAVNFGDEERLNIGPIKVGESDFVEIQAGGVRYVLDEHQLHRMLECIGDALRDRLDPVTRRYLRKVSDTLEAGTSFDCLAE
jgi:hypothetical protein